MPARRGHPTAGRLAILAAATVAVVALAGCGAPRPFEPDCPHWNEGLSHESHTHAFQNGTAATTREDVLGAGLLRDEGAPLERVVLDFGASDAPFWQGVELHDARIELQLRRADDDAVLRIFDRALGPPSDTNLGNETWTFAAGNRTAFALLSDMTLDGRMTPSPVVAQWRYTGDIDGNAGTLSGGVVAYTARYLYRVC